jgi:hypothetical protein
MRYFGPGDDSSPTPEQMEAWAARRSRPEHEVPYPVPLALLLVKTGDLAIAVSGMSAYSTGISFELAIRMRVRPTGLGRHEFRALMHDWDDDSDSRRFLLGVEYADGRRASNVGGHAWLQAGVPDDQPLLLPGGGGGSELVQDMSYWLSPTPPDGPLTFVWAWPALGVEETRHVVEDAALASASAKAIVLWPRQSRQATEPLPKSTSPLQGWFAPREEPFD